MTVMDDATARREATARLRAKAFDMRREGASFDTISSRLGITRAAARKLVSRELKTLAAEAEPEERRLLHAEVLMEIWRGLYEPAVAGDPAAIDRFLRVEERLARLLGLDAAPDGPAPARGRRRERAPEREQELERVGDLD
jgi:hypothetical protein